MKVFAVIALLFVLLSSTYAIKNEELNSVDKVIFYAIPHSHTDAGWYWTYEYYYGLAKTILNSVTKYLGNHSFAKFTWSDHSFFRKWFYEEVKGKKDKEKIVRDLVKSKRLDLVNGGLVQHDEAGSHMKEVYTNFEEGLDFLYDEFGVRPDTVWQLDPFGFSSATPEILKSLGFDKVIINRMSDAYKNVLRENQDLDFIWQGDGDEEIWTHTLHGHYGMDLAFYYDKRWYASNTCPNPLDKRCVKLLIEQSVHQGMKVHNKVGYVMQLIGNDFFFSNADYSFSYVEGMKKGLEKYGSQYLNGKPIEFRFATLSEYLHDTQPLKWEIGRYEGDFFEYTQYKAGDSRFMDHHWGGYFFSRPMFKWMVRDSMSRERSLHSMLASTKFLELTKETNIDEKELNLTYFTLLGAKEFNPVMLHHDAITGTHGQAVNIDYKRKIQGINNILDTSVDKLFNTIKTNQSLPTSHLELVFYNPSFYTRKEVVNVTLDGEHWSFIENKGFSAEIMDSYKLNKETFGQDNGEYILWIDISIPPFASEIVVLEKHGSKGECQATSACIEKVKTEFMKSPSGDLSLHNKFTETRLGKNSLEIKKVKAKDSGATIDVNENLYKYNAGDTKSCIYTFKPTHTAEKVHLKKQKFIKYSGKLVEGFQIYGNDGDFHYEKTVLLKHNDPALHIVSRNYILVRHDIEIALRHDGYDEGKFYTGDSMAYINRKFIDIDTAIKRNITRPNSKKEIDILGINTYPMVDGFITKKSSYIGFANSQSCAANLISPNTFEILIARSVRNVNQDKGLPERLYEKYMTHFNYKVYVAHDAQTIYDMKNIYVDQMNDPILVLKNDKKKSELPNMKFDGGETPAIDVISFKISETKGKAFSPGIIRLRNRSYKPVAISSMFFDYADERNEKNHVGLLSKTKYGYSDKETMDNLNYKQKVSENYNVKDDHNVLKNYRDEFSTLEGELIEIHGTADVKKDLYDIVLQPREIAHLKIYSLNFSKSKSKTHSIIEYMEKIKKEEEMREKAYNSDKEKKNAG